MGLVSPLALTQLLVSLEGPFSMPIHFSPDRWQHIKDNYRRWWTGDLGRPLFFLTSNDADPGRPEPELPSEGGTAYYGLDVSADAIVDRWDWNLSRNRYLADAFPTVWPNFGPGVLAAMIGGKLHATPETQTVWFGVPDEWSGTMREIDEIDFSWDPDNIWVRRIGDIERAAMDRWEGLVQVSMTDLGGNLDVLSTFRPGKQLLLDLVDHPDAVKHLTWREHEMWWRAFEHFNGILQPMNPGYTAWTPIFSELPYYMLQCDFCYMISPDMFDEFVRPELAASCRRLGNPFYHLDGPGELPHLKSLLSIPELKGVQWVPGTGNPEFDQWPEVYEKIISAGKLAQIWHGRAEDGRWHVDMLAERVGSADGFIVFGDVSRDDEHEVIKMLERYGAI